MSTNQNYTAYLLRFRWDGAQWRATLDDLHTGQRLRFAALPALLAHFVRTLAPGAPETAPAALPIHTQWVKSDVFDTQPRGRTHEREFDAAPAADAAAEPEARPRARREPGCFGSGRL